MKRIILVSFALFFVCSIGSAQIIADFQKDANGFDNTGWAAGVTSVTQVTDPHDAANKVLAVGINGSLATTGALQVQNLDASGAQIVTYYVWLPAGMPDSINLQLWAQDNNTWSWNSSDNMTKGIPKEQWFPISFYLEQARIDTGHFKIDHQHYKIGKMGIQVGFWGETDADKNWAGTIYIDNVSLEGKRPISLYSFETAGVGDFKALWGTPTFSRVADPVAAHSSGVLQSTTTSGSAMGVEATTDASKGHLLVMWVYLPANAPDALSLDVFAQDNKDWAWNADNYSGKNIPKQVWYPLYFNMAKYKATPGSKFDNVANKIGKFGMQFNGWDAGTIYLDDISVVGTGGDTWVIADFSAEAGGAQTITIPNFTPVSTAIAWDSYSGGSLKMTLDFAQGAGGGNQGKAGLLKNSVKIWNDTTAALIDGISMDVFFPTDLPAGTTVDIVYQPQSLGYPWMSTTYSISDSTIKKNQWQTLLWNPANFLTTINDSTQMNKKGLGNFVIQIYNATDITYKGVVYFDNLTLLGIKPPAGVVSSPAILTKTDTVKTKINTVVDFVQFNWLDNTAGDETYNIYASKTPITSLTGAGVVLLHPGIPHGLQKYGHRPYTANGDVVDLYYAITASQGGVEKPLGTGSASGKVSVKTSKTLKVKYVKNFAASFQLDGLDDEFAAYKTNQITPENAGDSASVNWTPASADCYFKTTLVIDDKYLYISADITDDEVNTNTSYQSWQGDAIEFYMGFYDTRTLTKLHGKNFSNSNGDWRIGFNSLGSTTLDGGSGTTVPGVESTVFVKLSGDGYIAEARIALDSMAAGKSFGKVTNGMLLPFKLDCNDIDPSKGDVGRTLILQTAENAFGSKVDMDQDWTRPHAWGLLEVIDGPTGVAQNDDGLPKEYKLYNSYPNPFNPSTTIKYDLKAESNVSLKVFNAVGQEVTTLVQAHQSAGRYSIVFNAKALSSGVYFYRLEAGPYVKVQKMMLLK